MSDCYPHWYQDWLFAALRLKPGDEAHPELLEPLYALNRQWVGDARPTDAGYVNDARTVKAYTLFYMTINMPKLWLMLDQSKELLDRVFTENDKVSILDLGCGPGTMTWAFLFYLLRRRPDDLTKVRTLKGIDRAPAFLKVAKRLGPGLKEYGAFEHLQFQYVEGDWTGGVGVKADIVLIGNTLNENPGLPPETLDALRCQALWIVEPGTRESFHRTLPFRDHMIQKDWTIQFPCPAPARCPMAEDNWCHFPVKRFTLPFIQRMAGKAKRLNPRHHFTGFAFERDQQEPIPDTWRVLSTLRKQSRSGIRFLCDGEHLVETVIGRRDRADSNRDFFECAPGELCQLRTGRSAAVFRQSKHIRKDDTFRRVHGEETGDAD